MSGYCDLVHVACEHFINQKLGYWDPVYVTGIIFTHQMSGNLDPVQIFLYTVQPAYMEQFGVAPVSRKIL